MSFLLRPVNQPARRISIALQIAALGLFSTLTPASLHAAADPIPTAEALAQLELRASQANPREQCFLYTELVHNMTQIAGKQIADGDIDHAAATLKQINHYAHLIHLDLARDTKRLKNAEILMHNTTY